MTFKPARLLFALIAVAAVPAFAQNIAVVNGKAIPSSRADAVVKQVVAQGQQPDSPQLREVIKKDLIAREVMMQEAIKQGFDKDAERQDAAGKRPPEPSSSTRWRATTSPRTRSPTPTSRPSTTASRPRPATRNTTCATSWSTPKPKRRRSSPSSRAAPSSKNWPRPRRTPAPPTTAATSTGQPRRRSRSLFSDAFVSLQKGDVTDTPVQTAERLPRHQAGRHPRRQAADAGRSQAADRRSAGAEEAAGVPGSNGQEGQGTVIRLPPAPSRAGCRSQSRDVLNFYRI